MSIKISFPKNGKYDAQILKAQDAQDAGLKLKEDLRTGKIDQDTYDYKYKRLEEKFQKIYREAKNIQDSEKLARAAKIREKFNLLDKI